MLLDLGFAAPWAATPVYHAQLLAGAVGVALCVDMTVAAEMANLLVHVFHVVGAVLLAGLAVAGTELVSYLARGVGVLFAGVTADAAKFAHLLGCVRVRRVLPAAGKTAVAPDG